MTEPLEFERHRFSQPTKDWLEVTENDTNLKFLNSELIRLTASYPNDFGSKTAVTICYADYQSVDVCPANMVTLTELSSAPNSFFKGRFFLCRTVTESIKVRPVLMVVEVPDPFMKNRGALISLYNYLHPLDEENVYNTPVLSKGTILALKNPIYFKSSVDHVYAIKCCNPADVVILNDQKFNEVFPGLSWPSNEVESESYPATWWRSWWNWWNPVPTIKDWKAIAGLRLNAKNFVGALEAYASALDFNPTDIEALSLRSALYLRLKVYRKCLEDSERILEMNNVDNRAVCNKALSLIGVGKYAEAVAYLRPHIQKCRPVLDFWRKTRLMEIVSKANAWSRQSGFGEYDLISMRQCPSTFIHDCADYVGNVVRQVVHGKGKGMIATADIRCGELIIAEKAFAMTHPNENIPKEVWTLNSDGITLRLNTDINLVASVAHRLITDLELGKYLYSLYDGTALTRMGDFTDYTYVDMNRISEICNYNVFSAHIDPSRSTYESTTQGIWQYASYFNHSCFDANSRWMICGNVIFIRASKDIKKNEEITISYVPIGMPYLKRLSVFVKHGFVCDCSLCQLDSKDSLEIHTRREEILDQISKLNAQTVLGFNLLNWLIEELEDLRRHEPKLNICIVDPLYKLAIIYVNRFDSEKAGQIFQLIHNCTFKTIVSDVAVNSCIYAIWCHLRCKKTEDVRKLVIALKFSLIQSYGTDSKEILKYASKGLAQALDMYGIPY